MVRVAGDPYLQPLASFVVEKVVVFDGLTIQAQISRAEILLLKKMNSLLNCTASLATSKALNFEIFVLLC